MDGAMSADEDEFVSQAGMMAATSSGEFAPRGRTERALDAMFNATGLHAVADFLRGNAAVAVVSWALFLVAGAAHVATHVGGGGLVETTMAANVSRMCTILVYVLAGTPEFVDVTYELAVGNVNIHVLTTLAVFGTVLLGCAMEGALLLVLFVPGALRGGSIDAARSGGFEGVVGHGAHDGGRRAVARRWDAGFDDAPRDARGGRRRWDDDFRQGWTASAVGWYGCPRQRVSEHSTHHR
jgi:hypothetical protein